MTSSPGTPTDLLSSSGTRRSLPGICSPSISSTTISRASFASSTLTDSGRLCRTDGSSRTNASEEARKIFSATFSAGKFRRPLNRTAAKVRKLAFCFSVLRLRRRGRGGGGDQGKQEAEDRKRAAEQGVGPLEKHLRKHLRLSVELQR